MATQVTGQAKEPNESRKYRIAVVTEDMVTISQHFGMARHYLVYEVEAGAIIRKETRSKPAHGPAMHDHHGGREVTPEMRGTHDSMLSNVRDCTVLIARGMGAPMYSAIVEAGMRAYVTRIRGADEAVRAFLTGNLDNHLELLH